MRIAQFISARVMNGAARHCLAFSAALTARGHEVTVFHRPDLREALGGTAAVRFEITDFRRSLRELDRIARRLAASGTQVIHTHMSSAHTLGAVLRAWRGVPTVATAHSRHFQLHWRFNDRVIAPARSTAAFHRRVNRIPASRLVVIPNFVDADAFAPASPGRCAESRRALGLAPDALVIGSVADIIALKRPSDLVSAARGVLGGPDEAVLLLAGAEIDAAEARRLSAASQGLAERVRRLGRVGDVGAVLAACDVFALASLTEEAPMAVLEAMACGLPIAATDVGGVGELAPHELAALLSPPRDVPALARNLQRLAADPGLRRRLGEAGRARALAGFAAGPIVERIEAVLAEAAALRPRWAGAGPRWPAGAGRNLLI